MTENCTNTVCTLRVVPLGDECLSSDECAGFPSNVCDLSSQTCRASTGSVCRGIFVSSLSKLIEASSDCITGDACAIVNGGLMCINITATRG